VSRVFAGGVTETYPAPLSPPLGSLYQAMLFRRGAIDPDGHPTANDGPIGRVDIPIVVVELRDNLLTKCRGVKAQIKLAVSGTSLCTSLATGVEDTRLLVLVGDVSPSLFSTAQGNVPRYTDRAAIAFGSSEGAARLHRVCAPPNGNLSFSDRIVPGQSIWYIALAWTADGHWDFVWSDAGLAPDVTPQQLTTKTRDISLEVRQLTCVDDSTFDGEEPLFTLALVDNSGQPIATDTYRWDKMESSAVEHRPPLSLRWSGGQESEGAGVEISAGNWSGSAKLAMPFDSPFSTNHLRIKGTVLGGKPGFFADVTTTVSYR